ncbi:hypothetical protein TcWFU_009740 [Taenia crassiceps]|uniref:Uncharacterized protein n=1 Tax=Taenia crassiceps TaxID=6207 RepID=A0ABR4QME2_9CEST
MFVLHVFISLPNFSPATNKGWNCHRRAALKSSARVDIGSFHVSSFVIPSKPLDTAPVILAANDCAYCQGGRRHLYSLERSCMKAKWRSLLWRPERRFGGELSIFLGRHPHRWNRRLRNSTALCAIISCQQPGQLRLKLYESFCENDDYSPMVYDDARL